MEARSLTGMKRFRFLTLQQLLCLVFTSMLCQVTHSEVFQINPDEDRVLITEGVYFAEWQELPTFEETYDPAFFSEVVQASFESQILLGAPPNEAVSWQLLDKNVSLPFFSSAAWLVLCLENPTDQDVDLLLELKGFGATSWFQVDGEGDVTQHRDDITAVRSGREVFDPFPIIPLEFEPGETKQVYIGLLVSVSLLWDLVLWQDNAFLEDRLRAMMLDWFVLWSCIYIASILYRRLLQHSRTRVSVFCAVSRQHCIRGVLCERLAHPVFFLRQD